MASKACLILLPSSVLIGIFWRLGSEEDNLPVVVTAWWKEVWTLPVFDDIWPGNLSV